MRVLISGGRDFLDEEFIFRTLDKFAETNRIAHLILGDAKGVDAIARKWGENRGIEYSVYYADWSRFGKAAGPIRNESMISNGKPDVAILFPGGKGTENMRHLCHTKNIPTIIAEYAKEKEEK